MDVGIALEGWGLKAFRLFRPGPCAIVVRLLVVGSSRILFFLDLAFPRMLAGFSGSLGCGDCFGRMGARGFSTLSALRCSGSSFGCWVFGRPVFSRFGFPSHACWLLLGSS